jgi:hypothetical protein
MSAYIEHSNDSARGLLLFVKEFGKSKGTIMNPYSFSV